MLRVYVRSEQFYDTWVIYLTIAQNSNHQEFWPRWLCYASHSFPLHSILWLSAWRCGPRNRQASLSDHRWGCPDRSTILVLLRDLLHSFHLHTQGLHWLFPSTDHDQSNPCLGYSNHHGMQWISGHHLLFRRPVSVQAHLVLVGFEPESPWYMSECYTGHVFDLYRISFEFSCRLDLWVDADIYCQGPPNEKVGQDSCFHHHRTSCSVSHNSH